MTNAHLPQGLVVPDVDEQTHNQNIIRVVKAEAENFHELSSVFPGLTISPGISLSPRLRLQRFLSKILEAYGDDVAGRQQEMRWLLNPEYIDYYKEGLAPPPRSEPWRTLLPLYFWFREVQKQFVLDYNTFVKREGIE